MGKKVTDKMERRPSVAEASHGRTVLLLTLVYVSIADH